VAGDDDRHRGAPDGRSDGANAVKAADRACDRPVRRRRAVRDASDLGPDAARERGALIEIERDIEGAALAGEVLVQLAGHLGEGVRVASGVIALRALAVAAGERDRAQAARPGDQRQRFPAGSRRCSR